MAEKQKVSTDGSGEEFDFYIKYRGTDGRSNDIGVRRGDRLSDILAKMSIQFSAGVYIRLNGVLITKNDAGELEVNPVLQAGDLLTLNREIVGGAL